MNLSFRNSSAFLFLIIFINGFTHLSAQLVNPNATAETKKLKSYLDKVYGKKILSGQVDDKYLQYIKDASGGKSPAIMGYDFNGICPSQGGNNDAQKAIDWVKNKKGIAQFQWHWISPNADGDFYSKNYNLAGALADTTTSSYKNLIRDMDLVAAALKTMQNAGVPVLWRPLHEAEGKWFWWGMSGGTACTKLYRLMYDRFVNLHKLNNLIWVWNSYGTTKENWYPGDDVVDIIAWDYPEYSGASSWNQYQQLFGGKGKLFAIGEDGKLTDPSLLSQQPWLYFLTWAYMIQDNNTKEWISTVYN
ncbi:MAG: beta-mannanase, partial [Bacteroidetes bacterium]|nr:beta-mannanase [Bacteroidota bacterium]